MDKHTQNDPLNPINHEPTKNFCEVCNIEESKTYFIENKNICEDCHEEEEEETKKNVLLYSYLNKTKNNY